MPSHSWYLSGRAVVYFFQAGVLFCKENAELLPLLAILSQIYALFGVLFTGLISVVVCQNWQISGMSFPQYQQQHQQLLCRHLHPLESHRSSLLSSSQWVIELPTRTGNDRTLFPMSILWKKIFHKGEIWSHVPGGNWKFYISMHIYSANNIL